MTNLTKLNNLFLVFWLLFIHSTLTFAADLTFTPAEPVVEVGKQITLSVSGTIGEVTWSAQQGWPDPPTGTQVTYNAPSNPKKLEDVVTVSDETGNAAILKVRLTTFPLENLNWEIFTDPGTIKDMVLSPDGKTLWVLTGDNTGCGPDIVREPSIEQRDANTGKLKRKFTTSTSSEGFPKSECPYLLLGASDEQLWLGTCDQGLAYYDSYTGKWTVYNKDSGLPDNQITSLLSDGSGGLWVNTPSGLAYRNKNKQWKIFNAQNSNLPSNEIQGVWIDQNEGGLWIETIGLKLTYLNPITEELMVYNTDNTGITFNRIQEIVSDGRGGLWMQMVEYSVSETEEDCSYVEYYDQCDGSNYYEEEVCYPVSTSQEKGIAHLSKDGKWDIFTTANSKLPGDNIQSMVSDQAGGLWIWTASESEPLKHLSASYEWTTLGVTGNSSIVEIISDDKGGLWVVRESNIVHITNTQSAFSEWTAPELTVGVIIKIIGDGKGGLWVVRRGSGWHNGGDVVHITHTQQVNTFQYKETSLLGRIDARLFVRDDNEGLWIGTDQGLVHLGNDGTFNTPNPLPFFENGTVVNDGNGGLWMWDASTLELSHFANEGETVSFNQLGDLLAHLGLPSNNIYTLANDDKGGLWIGTDNGLAYLTQTGQWNVFTAQNSALPSNTIHSVISHQSELWVGTDKGLVHLDGSGVVTVYNTDNSDLPDNDISTLLSDGNQGIWVGTNGGGLAHLTNEQWTMFSTENSSLPDNSVHALVSDDNGGIWIGTSSGLVHLNSNQEMTIFNSDNSQLPASGINALLSDGQGGLWVGTYTGLAHLIQPRNQWKIFNMDNSVLTLASDGNGGLWIGTDGGGLTHFDGKRQWTNSKKDNSNLPGDYLKVITNDGKGGLWIGTLTNGLVHFDGDQQWNVYNAVNMSVSFLNDGHGRH
ncbi:MAG: hypothetical protein BWK78_08540 [Thiotrichaceae bacterium IS1]|nr:MAG: hypothetical protein BWK78_08540 [Thiotrichaceae bacterium IS1]